MILPNADKAIIKTEKITDYVLNFEHFEGKNKARVFASALGLRKENADYLIDFIHKAILTNDAVEQPAMFGARYTVDLISYLRIGKKKFELYGLSGMKILFQD